MTSRNGSRPRSATATRRSCSSAKNGSNKRRKAARHGFSSRTTTFELRAALSRKLLLVPVLVGGARHAEARATARGHWGHHHKEALPHRHESFDDDTEYIVAAVLACRRRNALGKRRARSRQRSAMRSAARSPPLYLCWLERCCISCSWGDCSPHRSARLSPRFCSLPAIARAWMGLRYEMRKRRLR